MSPEKWQQIESVYYDALELAGTERAMFLDRACAGDAELRREVESLLAAHDEAGHFITTPAMDVVARQIAEHHLRGESTQQPAGKTAPFTSSPLDTAHTPSLAPGTLLGDRYSVECELGHGGVGEVFLARDRKLLDSHVVVKLMREHLRDSSHRAWFEKKFKQEIAALSRIDHPGVVRALDVGELEGGRSYFVMQYVPGVSLRTLLAADEARGGMELKYAARLLRQMGQALTAAHRHGVIHRDLKPENIMLQPVGDEEYVKLIDFGIATVLDDASASGITTTTIIGTREYMAPEQLMGRPEAASDIYALGIVAYEMLTGRRPFDAASVADLYAKQRKAQFRRPRELRPALPAAAEAAILRALAFDPAHRFAQAKDFTDTLARALTADNNATGIKSAAAPAVRAGTGRRTEVWLSLAAAVLIVCGAGAAMWWRGSFVAARSAKNHTQPTPVATLPERELSYSLTVRKDPRRYPKSKPFLLPGEIIFEAGYHVRLILRSPQDGYLYVINEGPAPVNGRPAFHILFPDTLNNGGSALIHGGASVQIPPPSDSSDQDWFVFDAQEGVEKVWLVWAAQPVDELEAVKRYANPQDQGVISDVQQINAVVQYLKAHAANRPLAERDEAQTLTRLKARGETLVWLIRLEHH